MKRIIIAFSFLSLVGCMNLNFDAVELNQLTTLHELSVVGLKSCGTVDAEGAVNAMQQPIEHLRWYTAHRGGQQQVAEAVSSLNNIVGGLIDRYKGTEPVSKTYCEVKFKQIDEALNTIATTTGRLY